MKGYFKVDGLRINVREVEQNCRNDTYMGRSDTRNADVTICSDMSDDEKEATLIHEYIHVILDLYAYLEESNNEKLVCFLARKLYEQGFRIKLEGDK